MRCSNWATVGGLAALFLSSPVIAAEKRFGLTSFERIVLNGDYVVEVVSRAPLGAVATGSNDALDRLELRSEGGTLTISDRHFGSNRQRGRNAGVVTIRVNAAQLRSASVSGAGSLTIDRMRGAKVELALTGPGSLIVTAITADRLNLSVVGNGAVRLAGTAKTANAVVSGAGLVDASALAVTDLIADGEGAGDQRFQAIRTAQLLLRGVGKMVVTGKAKCNARNLSSGTLICGK